MTRYLRVGKNPRRVSPPATVLPPTTGTASQATLTDYYRANTGSGTSHNYTLPSNFTTGDLLLMGFYTESGPYTHTAPAFWTSLDTDTWSNARLSIWYHVADGTETSGSITTSGTTGGAVFVWGVAANGIDFSTYLPEGSVVAGSNNPPAVTPSWGASEALVFAILGTQKLLNTIPSGYTAISTNSNLAGANDEEIYDGYKRVDIVTSEDPGAFTVTNTSGQNPLAATIAVRSEVSSDPNVAAYAHTHAVNDATDVGTGATTKGDLLVHDGTDYERLAVGSNNQVLTADSAQSLGVKWATAGGGASALNDLTDVTITAAATGEVLQYNGSAWVDAGLPLTDLSNVTISSAVTGEVLKYNGSIWVNDTDDTGSGSLPTPSAKGDIAVYNGSSWVIRAVGTNDQVLTADSAQSDGVKWAAAGAAAVPEWISLLDADGSETTGDDFADDSLAGTTVTVTGGQSVTEDRDLLSVTVSSTISVDDVNCQLFSRSMATGDIIEVAVRAAADAGGNGFMFAGPVFTDGTSSTSNAVYLAARIRDSQLGQWDVDLRAGTLTVISGTISTTYQIKQLGPLAYWRLKYISTTSFEGFYSVDGVSWSSVGTITPSAITPTHFGVGWSVWGDTFVVRQASFEYVRIY